MALKNEALRNGIKQTALLRSKLKGTSYFQEVTKMKAELEAKLLKDNQELAQNNQKLQNHSEFDPELYTMGAKMASYHIGRGTNSFADFSKAMINDLGIKIKPFLKSLYEGVRNYPGIDNAGMTPYDEVSKIILDNIELVNSSPKISEYVERQPVHIKPSSTGTDSEIQDNKTSIQPTGGQNRPGFAEPTEEIRAIIPASESGLSSGGIDDVVPGDIASLFRQ